jgi:magnesium chelatase family protein
LPETAVTEGRKRIRAAIISAGLEFPIDRITVNLAPANLKKRSVGYDLPIALGILAASGQIPAENLHHRLFFGELALDGSLRSVNGALAIFLLTIRLKLTQLFLPYRSLSTLLSLGETIQGIVELKNLGEVYGYLQHSTLENKNNFTEDVVPPSEDQIKALVAKSIAPAAATCLDWRLVCGQEIAKRALLIAAAGFHSALLLGSPGVGKSLLARSLGGFLPLLLEDEALEVALLKSMEPRHHFSNQNHTDNSRLLLSRPVRAPHHKVSISGFIGGKQGAFAGELALAHRGILLMDEFPEFHRDVIEVLREPMEMGEYHLSRGWGEVRYPSRFMLIATMNPCPCGYFGDREKSCQCSPTQIQRYRQRISAPILDRIDLHVLMTRAKNAPKEIVNYRHDDGNSIEKIRRRIEMTVAIQQKRYQKEAFSFNAHLPIEALDEFCRLDVAAAEFLPPALERLKLSHRAHHRLLRVARTIADFSGEQIIQKTHLLEALQYRQSVL